MSGADSRGSVMQRNRLINFVIYSAIGACAWFINQSAGNRGIFAFDQSFVIDGAYRLYRGQTIYEDFFAPFGVVAFYYTAIFLKLFGVKWSSYVAGASVINVLTAWLQMALLQAVGVRNPFLISAVGLMSAAGTISIIGTVYPEYLAFLFGLMGLLLLYSDRINYPILRLVFSGLLIALAFHTKQNLALGFFPIMLVSLFFFDEESSRVKRALYVVTWLIVAVTLTALPAIYFAITGRFENFLYYSYTLPSTLGADRIKEGNLLLWMVLPALVCGAAVSVFGYRKSAKDILPSEKLQTTRGLLLLFHAFFLPHFLEVTMNQDPFARHMLLGILLCLFLVYLRPFMKLAEIELKPFLQYTFAILLFSGAILFGLHHSISRLDQEPISRSKFGEPMRDRFFDTLRWGMPTYADHSRRVELPKEQFEEVLNLVRADSAPFFVYPDFSILYVASGKLPPHPYLWFHPGLTFKDEDKTDNIIKQRLMENDVKTVILESDYFNLMIVRGLSIFPKTKSYIEDNFRKDSSGIFSVYRKEEPAREIQ